jgi:O-antigen/teichoic acid export membrane protein
MSTSKKLFKSSVARTFYTVLNMAVAFFMMPFIVGKLGDHWYGVWVVIGSIGGYYYILDFGLASAVTRYFNTYIAKNDIISANKIINTSLLIYILLGLVIIILTIILLPFIKIFINETTNYKTVCIVLFIVGLKLALEFPFKAFAGIIQAHLRYDLLTYSHLLSLTINTSMIVLFLSRGSGILSLAIIGFLTSQISNIIFYLITRYLFREMRISKSYIDKKTLSELFSYSTWSFVINIASQFRFKIDSIVIGSVLSAVHVTHYFVGARLVEYFVEFLYKGTNILTPVFTQYHAMNNYKDLRDKLLFVSKINAVLAFFGGGIILIIGKAFIKEWMGEEYLDAYPILAVLLCAMIIEVTTNPLTNILYASAKHKALAKIDILEGFLNILLSILLIKYYGINGVAFGTAIPLIIFRICVLPVYVCKIINLPVNRYYANLLSVVLFTLVYCTCYYVFMNEYISSNGYLSIILGTAIALPLYGSCLLLFLLKKNEKAILLNLLPKKKVAVT